MAIDDNAVLGIAMGTSQAAGYVTSEGTITSWLNELAFAPVDYNPSAPVDEWSGDSGCGVQYFSQQCVGRLLPLAGIAMEASVPLAEKLKHLQSLMMTGDTRARGIYQTIGVYLGYALAHYADFYEFRNVLILGRVTSGPGGDILLSCAREVLEREFQPLAARIRFHVPGEKEKRHGQAIAAASLPQLPLSPLIA
jgi:predicted NBD/HSP70 family sugar kinase